MGEAELGWSYPRHKRWGR